MSLTTTIHQSEILGGPQSAIVRNYSLEETAGMEVDFRAALPQVRPSAVGVLSFLSASTIRGAENVSAEDPSGSIPEVLNY
jgi:hypothetical protein